MSSSTPNPKFLLDENVKAALAKSLGKHSYGLKLAPKGTTDKQLALISKSEKRILITNDSDFQWYDKNQIYSVILLNIPQNDSKALISSFEKLLREFNNFGGRIILLETAKWQDFPLWEETS